MGGCLLACVNDGLGGCDCRVMCTGVDVVFWCFCGDCSVGWREADSIVRCGDEGSTLGGVFPPFFFFFFFNSMVDGI